MDVSAVLKAVRQEKGWSQRDLADRAETARTAVCAYERGTRSPRVATLVRLVAAAGLQMRVELEPLHADVLRRLDAEVDALLAPGGVRYPLSASLVEALDEERSVVTDEERDAADAEGRSPVPTRARLQWALDGRSALAAQGLGRHGFVTELAFERAPVVRRWLFDLGARGADHDSWFAGSDDNLAQRLQTPVITLRGTLRIRLVEAMTGVVHVLEEPDGPGVPALGLLAVEQQRADLRPVLARLRERQLA